MTMETATIIEAGATTSIEDEERVLETTLLASLARLQEMHVAVSIKLSLPVVPPSLRKQASQPLSSNLNRTGMSVYTPVQMLKIDVVLI